MSEKYYIGRDIMSFEDNGDRKPISRVTLLLDGETGYTAGDDTGAELTAECYFATQEMADALLERVKGYTYRAFSAGRANLDPAAELGDGATVGGVYSTIASLSDHGRGYPDVAAPGERELEEEYESGSPLMRSIERSLATVRAEFRIDIDSITSSVEDLDGDISKIDQKVDSITLSVQGLDGEVYSLELTLNGVTIAGPSGETLIKGSSIDTSSIKANSITADKLNLSGSITFDDLDTDAQDAINDAYYLAYDAVDIAEAAEETVSGWTYGSTTYIDGTQIMTGTVRASTLEGGVVEILTSADKVAGTIMAAGAQTASFSLDFYTGGAMGFEAYSGNIFLAANTATGGTDINMGSSTISVNCDAFFGAYENLGTSTYYWNDLYVYNDPIVVSDLNKKTAVDYDLSAYEALYDLFRPVSFLFKDGTSGRRHIGMIAQDVEAALSEAGIDTKDFAGFIKSPATDDDGNIIEGEYNYALRYGEWTSLNIWQIQQLKQRVAELEAAVYG